ncbi:transcriptional regulator [Streptomyces cinnamoneus]|uniref:Transcriptional regulator n=2 Tax=Streptomyces cinnamoneus TaxID=53446 RepID=A0A2G1XA58_STRCJ|nr:transcriptional regulator [Streptomyces cinnamoneus]PPT15721.1 transcriptional regulator [Streptomyces cinnamoneus]
MDREGRTGRDGDDAARGPAGAGGNRLVPLIAAGSAPRAAVAALALEQHHVIPADRRSFRHLAERAAQGRQPAVAAFFAHLEQGEGVALERLGVLAAACGLDAETLRAHEPRAGCQAYPAYVAWLALGAEPVDVVVALSANFAAWGGYCATVAQALRRHYGFTDEACGFFDFFAEPDPRGAALAAEAGRAGRAEGLLTERLAHRYGRMLQEYESMFWNTLADTCVVQ